MLFTADLARAQRHPQRVRHYGQDDVTAQLVAEFTTSGVPREVIDLVEYPLTCLLTGLYWLPERRPHTAAHSLRPLDEWDGIARALDRWGWP